MLKKNQYKQTNGPTMERYFARFIYNSLSSSLLRGTTTPSISKVKGCLFECRFQVSVPRYSPQAHQGLSTKDLNYGETSGTTNALSANISATIPCLLLTK